jgi:hypothetical protein
VATEDHVQPYCDVLSQNVLAHKFGLTASPKKVWRFRDFRRGLFARLSPEHSKFIYTHSEHSLMRQRLPHKMSVRSFALRLLLLTFHYVVAEGRVPSWWSKVNLPLMAAYLPLESIRMNPSVAQYAHHLIEGGVDVEEAVARAQSNAEMQGRPAVSYHSPRFAESSSAASNPSEASTISESGFPPMAPSGVPPHSALTMEGRRFQWIPAPPPSEMYHAR